MRRRGVLWTWALLAFGLTGVLLGTMMSWYEVEADGNTFYSGRMGQEAPAEDEPAWDAYKLHVALFDAVHVGTQQAGVILDHGEDAHIERVVGVTRVFYTVGAVGLTLAGAGLVVRMATGAHDGGFTAATATLATIAVVFALLHFSTGIADGIDRQLEARYGQGPEIAFITIDGGPEGSEIWAEVTSGPMAGYFVAWLGTVLAVAGIVTGHIVRLRDLGRRLLTEDPAPRGLSVPDAAGTRQGKAERQDTPAFKERLRKEVD